MYLGVHTHFRTSEEPPHMDGNAGRDGGVFALAERRAVKEYAGDNIISPCQFFPQRKRQQHPLDCN